MRLLRALLFSLSAIFATLVWHLARNPAEVLPLPPPGEAPSTPVSKRRPWYAGPPSSKWARRFERNRRKIEIMEAAPTSSPRDWLRVWMSPP